MRIYGVDFTSAPRAQKPITVAWAVLKKTSLVVEKVELLESFGAFEDFLRRPGPWVGGFDFPFGLSREAVEKLGWPVTWDKLVAHCKSLGKAEFKRILDKYRESRPPGDRYAKRRGDSASGAHPSVKLVNPPVGFMFFEGAHRLLAAGVTVPGLCEGDHSRIALEAYPGLLVRNLGIRESYKSDDRKKQTLARKKVRRKILDAVTGQKADIRLELKETLASRLIEDGSGDQLDAVLCAVQAAWGQTRRDARFGLPAEMDPLEGWIISA